MSNTCDECRKYIYTSCIKAGILPRTEGCLGCKLLVDAAQCLTDDDPYLSFIEAGREEDGSFILNLDHKSLIITGREGKLAFSYLDCHLLSLESRQPIQPLEYSSLTFSYRCNELTNKYEKGTSVA